MINFQKLFTVQYTLITKKLGKFTVTLNKFDKLTQLQLQNQKRWDWRSYIISWEEKQKYWTNQGSWPHREGHGTSQEEKIIATPCIVHRGQWEEKRWMGCGTTHTLISFIIVHLCQIGKCPHNRKVKCLLSICVFFYRFPWEK